ncbi:MAG: YceI family protein [Lewinellaceae bacterium]|nr:YceI family protein [Lewinellaceae bacterium]
MHHLTGNKKHISLPILFILLCPLLLALDIDNALFLPTQFTVEDSSKLYLQGSTNINTFRCDCKEQFSTYSMTMTETESGQKVQFSDTKLRIPSSRFDCGNRLMNKDMFETLKGDKYPQIQIELMDATQLSGKKMGEATDWVPMKATTAITIAGIEKVVKMDVLGKKIAQGRFQFKGNKDIYLSDYRLEPPSPMMGLVQVNDVITIHLDLVVKVI